VQRDRAPKDTQKRGRAPSLPCSLNLIRDAKSEPKALEAHGRRAIQKSSTVHLGWHNAIHSTMAIHTPSLFTDSDVLTFRETPVSDYRIPYTFVESLNEGTLFDRSARTFEEAARTQRLYDVIVGEHQRIIGAGMLQDSFKEADGHHREEELGALMVHPAARGIGIVGLM
jgi:hypothetical protein